MKEYDEYTYFLKILRRGGGARLSFFFMGSAAEALENIVREQSVDICIQ